MNFKVTFEINEQNANVSFGENVTVIPTDKAFEIVLDEIIEEQENIIAIQNNYIGGEGV